ncbi:MAG TPA: hypothetical protein VHP34_08920, partial [Alphaproteobacteria bacterium]|nr:hypothetical protein [Alphaproteobacteria bacterium]
GLMEASTDSSPVGDNQYFEKYVQGAVRFTPYARAQVEGYLLSDHENNLDFAVCYLWPYHQKEVLASLMNECLLRALGLPEMASVQGAGVLGHWNKTYDRVSKRSVLDGPTVNEWLASVAKTEMGWTRSGEDAAYGRELEKLIAKGNRKDLFTNYPKIVKQRLSEFDLAMLSMLYCADIRPGMGRYEILDAFYKSNNCFAFKGVSKAAK